MGEEASGRHQVGLTPPSTGWDKADLVSHRFIKLDELMTLINETGLPSTPARFGVRLPPFHGVLVYLFYINRACEKSRASEEERSARLSPSPWPENGRDFRER